VLLQTVMSRLQNNRDGLQSLFCYIPVIALRPVPLPLKLKGCVLVIFRVISDMHSHCIPLAALFAAIKHMENNKLAANLGHVLAVHAPVRFGPLNLTRISLHLEIFMTLRTAKAKDLQRRQTIQLHR
jgi:hypothetical protein